MFTLSTLTPGGIKDIWIDLSGDLPLGDTLSGTQTIQCSDSRVLVSSVAIETGEVTVTNGQTVTANRSVKCRLTWNDSKKANAKVSLFVKWVAASGRRDVHEFDLFLVPTLKD